jgi:hypothetical protein
LPRRSFSEGGPATLRREFLIFDFQFLNKCKMQTQARNKKTTGRVIATGYS